MSESKPPRTSLPRRGRARTAEGAGHEFQTLDFGRRNWILFGAGLLAIVAGFGLLAAGDITIAPILLVGGYCGLIPWALVARSPQRTPGAGGE